MSDPPPSLRAQALLLALQMESLTRVASSMNTSSVQCLCVMESPLSLLTHDLQCHVHCKRAPCPAIAKWV